MKDKCRQWNLVWLIMMILIVSTLFIPFSSSVKYIISQDVIPSIIITFNEFTSLENTYLVEETDLLTPIETDILTYDNITFHIKPKIALNNGDYILYFDAYDRIGNILSDSDIRFSIDSEETAINYVNPPHGVASSLNYDVQIATNDYSFCKYSLYKFSPTAFYSDPNIKSFDNESDAKLLHDINSFNIKVSDSTPVTIHVRCEDSSTRLAYKELTFTVDTTQPVLSGVAVDPKKITYLSELNQGSFPITHLSLNSNEGVVCKYTDDASAPYEAMHWFNSSFSSSNGHQFPKEYFKTSAETDLILTNLSKSTHTYYVQCENLAGTLSDKKTVSFDVDLGAMLDITIVAPTEFTNETQQSLHIKTSKPSFCQYSLNQSTGTYISTDSSLDNMKLDHFANLGNFNQGVYELIIKCIRETQSVKSYSFTVDLTPPIISNFTHHIPRMDEQPSSSVEYTYLKDELSADWIAVDTQSPIEKYSYKIANNANEDIIDWQTTSKTTITVDNLNLSDYETYFWFVKAQNAAGTWSSVYKSKGIQVNSALEPDDYHCENEVIDYDETSVDCGGSCDPCSVGDSCDVDTDCESNKCLNNKCADDLCNNGVYDLGESDIDCGINCNPCADGDACLNSLDCASLYCNQSICESSSCADGIQNGLETDVDCGGSSECFLCEIGKSCKSNADCDSNYCNDNFVCANVNCFNGIMDDGETGVDCGGSCSQSCDAISCIGDNDCTTGICNQTTKLCTQSNASSENFTEKDSDGDTMYDLWEAKYSLNPLDPSDAFGDLDSDKLLNKEEFKSGTNPLVPDSDGDGYTDWEEINAGFDPMDPNDKPKNNFFIFILLLLLLILIAVVGYIVYNKFSDKFVKHKGPQLNIKTKNPFVKKENVPVKKAVNSNINTVVSSARDTSAIRNQHANPDFIRNSLPQGRFSKSKPKKDLFNGLSLKEAQHRKFLREQKEKQKQRFSIFDAFDDSEKVTVEDIKAPIKQGSSEREKLKSSFKNIKSDFSETPKIDISSDNINRMFTKLRSKDSEHKSVPINSNMNLPEESTSSIAKEKTPTKFSTQKKGSNTTVKKSVVKPKEIKRDLPKNSFESKPISKSIPTNNSSSRDSESKSIFQRLKDHLIVEIDDKKIEDKKVEDKFSKLNSLNDKHKRK